ncbi:aminoglycoside phosphotransferase family protein [Sneathiella sp.]|jgi:aminoglycoside/choline kinase family phosphotransferase|uniref:aminoglycoside phosphotransferase family protein n=1 Tax=Sneathiella sp. TaxID=1964365 RepID=UPI0039E522A2
MTLVSEDRIIAFIEKAGWKDAWRHALAGDASSRRYERLTQKDKTAILMVDPSIETMDRFVRVTGLLHKMGYSAPEILTRQKDEGLLLLEDFGDRLFTQCIEQGAPATDLYRLAVDLLLDLRTQKLPENLPYFSPSYVLNQNALFLDWFVSDVNGRPVPENARLFYQQIWQELMVELGSMEEVFLFRDFHAENMMHLEQRSGLKALGLIDYQDAMIGPAAYDLVSLLQDARRDVGAGLEQEMLTHYIEQSGVDHNVFYRQYAIFGAHRALRILGIFTRLSKRDGKDRYQKFVPRVKSHLSRNLAHPDLLPLQHWLALTLGKALE